MLHVLVNNISVLYYYKIFQLFCLIQERCTITLIHNYHGVKSFVGLAPDWNDFSSTKHLRWKKNIKEEIIPFLMSTYFSFLGKQLKATQYRKRWIDLNMFYQLIHLKWFARKTNPISTFNQLSLVQKSSCETT